MHPAAAVGIANTLTSTLESIISIHNVGAV
jgi:hypothetical protein